MKLIATLVVACVFPGIVFAEPATLATSRQGSSTHAMGLAISKAASDVAGLDIRPVPHASTSQASALVNDGDLVFGLENAVGIAQAMNGAGRFEGNKMDNLRLVARLLPLRFTFGVRKDSDIQSVSDLAGKRVPSGFGKTVTGELLISTMLGTAGLGYDDVERVQVASFSAMAEAFTGGDLDAYIFIPGSPRDVNISLQVGGVRPLDLPSDEASLAFVAEKMPVGRLFDLEPIDEIKDVETTTTVLQYDYFIYTNADTDPALINGLLTSLISGKETMTEMVASLRWFERDLMRADVGLEYHPAAAAFYEANGIQPN